MATCIANTIYIFISVICVSSCQWIGFVCVLSVQNFRSRLYSYTQYSLALGVSSSTSLECWNGLIQSMILASFLTFSRSHNSWLRCFIYCSRSMANKITRSLTSLASAAHTSIEAIVVLRQDTFPSLQIAIWLRSQEPHPLTSYTTTQVGSIPPPPLPLPPPSSKDTLNSTNASR